MEEDTSRDKPGGESCPHWLWEKLRPRKDQEHTQLRTRHPEWVPILTLTV